MISERGNTRQRARRKAGIGLGGNVYPAPAASSAPDAASSSLRMLRCRRVFCWGETVLGSRYLKS